MRSLVGYARSTFWTIGIVQILMGLYIAVASRPHSASRPHAGALLVMFGLLITALGALSCLAARAWRHKKRFAIPLVAINSVFCLLFFPFGTVAGAVGLYWCCSPKQRGAEPLVGDFEHFEHQSKPGDGTHAWMQKVVPVVEIVIGVGSLFAAGWWGHTHRLPQKAAINGLLLLILCEWIAVFCHELGHAVAGWAVDMRLASFVVGPFVAREKAGRWKFQLVPLAILTTGGAVASAPLRLNDLRRRMAFEIAGGPVASMLTALVALLILLAMPGSAWAAWWKVPAVVAAISGSAAVLNLIPFGFAAGFSDGALLVQLLRGGPFADLREALKMVLATTVTATRPRDLDARALAEGMRAGVGSPNEGMLQMIQLICAVDRRDLTVAREHLENSLLRIAAPDKAPDASCAAEMAFYIAYLDGNASRAGLWLRGAEKVAAAGKIPLTREFDYWLATTAVREAEGRREEADEAYRRATQLAEQKPPSGQREYDRELLRRVREGDWLRRQDAGLREASV